MKFLFWGTLGLALLTQLGCTSKVMTYDKSGTLIGSCEASAFIFKQRAHCYGYSKTENVYFSKPELVRTPVFIVKPPQISSSETISPPQTQYSKPALERLPEIQQTPMQPKNELPTIPSQNRISITNLTPIL